MLEKNKIKSEINQKYQAYLQNYQVSETIDRDWQSRNLYHYTSIKALAGIVKSQEIHISHFTGMNDTRELFFGLDVLHNVLDKQNMLSNIIQEEINAFQQKSIKILPEVYIFSMSKLKDNVLQWLAYGDNGQGIAIEFNPLNLHKIINEFAECSIYRGIIKTFYFESGENHFPPEKYTLVNGNSQEYELMVSNIFKHIVKLQVSEGIKRELIREYLVLLGSSIKSAFHVDEDETRLIFLLKKNCDKVESYAEQDNPKMHYKFPISNYLNNELISKIITGPKTYNNLSAQHSVQKIINKEFSKIQIVPSLGQMK